MKLRSEATKQTLQCKIESGAINDPKECAQQNREEKVRYEGLEFGWGNFGQSRDFSCPAELELRNNVFPWASRLTSVANWLQPVLGP